MSALPAVFLSYQQELMSSVSTYSVTVGEKSRRTGYSWAAAAIAAMTASAAKGAGGSDVLYMGYEKEMTREFIDYVAMWGKQIGAAAAEVDEFVFDDPDHPEKSIKAFRVTFASGFEVVALPNVARALRGKQGLVILDEAAFMDNLQEVLKAALAHLIWGGKVLIISTHNGDENPFNTLVQEIRAGKKPYHLLRCTFDEALVQGLYKRICFTQGKEWTPEGEIAWRAEIVAFYGDGADEELNCIPREGGGAALSRALIDKRMVVDGPVLRLTCKTEFVHWAQHLREAEIADWCEKNVLPILKKLDPETPHCFGLDFARRSDLSVLAPMQLLRSLVRRVPFMVEMRNVPFEQQRQVLFYVVDRLPMMRAGKLDETGNGMYLAEVAMQRYGETRIERVTMSEPWYREHMPPFKAAFEDATIELPRDRDVMDDLALLAFVRGVIRVPERTLGSDGGGRHGDAAVALALAYAASRAEPESYAFDVPAAAKSKAERDWPETAEEWAEDTDAADGAPSMMPALHGGMQGSPRGVFL